MKILPLFVPLFLFVLCCAWESNAIGPQKVAPEQPTAHFNGSSFLRVTIPPIKLIGLSFRTCTGGEIYSHQKGENAIQLFINGEGVNFFAKTAGKQFEERLKGNFLDNNWHKLYFHYQAVNVSLYVDEQLLILANTTYRRDLLTPEIYNDSAVLILGNNFNGCMLEGPSIAFNESYNHNVGFPDDCPISDDTCNVYGVGSRLTGELRRGCSSRGEVLSPPGRARTSARLKDLRNIMRTSVKLGDRPIDALLVTTHDDHQSEFVADVDKRLEFISGFSGSMGEAIVTQKKSALWTDGRYYLQADEQLDCNWLLLSMGYSEIPSKAQWLKQQFPNGARVGADPKVIANCTWSELENELVGSGIELIELSVNPIDKVWVEGRPPRRNSDAFVWELKYAGKKWATKVDETRNEMVKLGANAMIVTALDEIAWLLNIRGRDIPHNPFVRSYVILTTETVTLYVNSSQLIQENIRKHLNSDYGVNSHAVIIKDYLDVWTDIPTESQKWTFLLPARCIFSLGSSHAIYSLVPKEKQVPAPSPIIFLKARKNHVEIQGMEHAHIRDAAAMCKFFSYFEKRFPDYEWTELEIVRVLNEYRFEQDMSLGNSFRTIAAFGPNGAQPNYEPTPNTNVRIFDNNTLVLDSGGQYLDGTTDVSRTLHLGEPTDDQKEAYTRVLMGIIQFATLVFPNNLKLSTADVLLRAPLWQVGLDYAHESGHGIGTFSVYRESPIKIQYQQKEDQYFKPGYFLSNEPAYYREGEFGIRLENILEVIETPWLKHATGQVFFGFKVVTLVPFEPKLMDLRLLTFHHRKWLNRYNAQIRKYVGPELMRKNNTDAFFWMMKQTEYIPEYGHSSIIQSPSVTYLIANVLVVKLFFFV